MDNKNLAEALPDPALVESSSVGMITELARQNKEAGMGMPPVIPQVIPKGTDYQKTGKAYGIARAIVEKQISKVETITQFIALVEETEKLL